MMNATAKKTTSRKTTPKPKPAAVQTYQEPSQLLQLAIQKDLDVEKLERLMVMQREWVAYQARMAFYDALSDFQANVPDLLKNARVTFDTDRGGPVNYSYAPLSSIIEQIKKPLNQYGLSYRWEFDDSGERITGTCIVTHRDGHSEKTAMSAPADTSGKKNAVQSRGSTMTYMQRYTLIGALGLATADTDTDGRGPANGQQAGRKSTGRKTTQKKLEFKRTMVLPAQFKKFAGKQLCTVPDEYLTYMINYIGNDGKQTQWGQMAQQEWDIRHADPEETHKKELLASIAVAKQNVSESAYNDLETQLLTGADLTNIEQASVDHLVMFLDDLRAKYKEENSDSKQESLLKDTNA